MIRWHPSWVLDCDVYCISVSDRSVHYSERCMHSASFKRLGVVGRISRTPGVGVSEAEAIQGKKVDCTRLRASQRCARCLKRACMWGIKEEALLTPFVFPNRRQSYVDQTWIVPTTKPQMAGGSEPCLETVQFR